MGIPHLPSYYHEQHTKQVEQLRSEMQAFQNNVLSKVQEIARSLEKERSRTHDVHMNVIYLKDELRQVHKLLDALVTHLIMPELPLQKIREAIAEIRDYRDNLQKRQQSLDSLHQTFATDVTQVLTEFSAILSSTQRNTDGIVKVPMPLVEYKEEPSSNEKIEN